jgi:UDP-N-acetylmuramoylalanine--D-glutamate ligase
MMKSGEELTRLAPVSALHLPGNHNLANALAACTAAFAAGFPPEAMQKGIDAVKGVPHRLELVREREEVRWYNDSIATAPERVIASVNAVEEHMVLLLGGRDKDLPWGNLADLLNERKPKVILFGEAGDLVKRALKKTKPDYPIYQVKALKSAVKKAAKIAERGESVLLSPGGTSFDAYRDFEERGEHFRSLVKELK